MRYPVAALRADGERVPAVLAGPTCDSIDVIDDHLDLPMLDAGDLVVGRQMGAYTAACATDFNFFRRARVVAVNVAQADATAVTDGEP
jgi:ornithine decarboxylase